MNDFTITDLKYLLWAIKYVRDRTNNCGDAMRKLERNIQTMINTFPLKKECNLIRDVNSIEACPRCGKYHE